MTDKKKAHKDDVSISAKVDSTGVRIAAQLPADLPRSLGSGIAKAIRFAFAGAAPDFFSRAHREMAIADVRSVLVTALANNVGDPVRLEQVTDLLVSLLDEQQRKLGNRTKLFRRAVEHVVAPDAQASITSDKDIGDDFLSHFWRTADDISQDEMREVFARILAREIRSPNSFSASTLNLLPTLHPLLAEKFALLCAMTFSFDGLVFVIVSMPRAVQPHLATNTVGSSQTIGEQLSDFGLQREDLLDLRSVGLIRSLPEEEYPNLEAFLKAARVDFAGTDGFLEMTAAAPPGRFSATAQTNVISLTRSGAELRAILQLRPHRRYAEALTAIMDTAGVKFRY